MILFVGTITNHSDYYGTHTMIIYDICHNRWNHSSVIVTVVPYKYYNHYNDYNICCNGAPGHPTIIREFL